MNRNHIRLQDRQLPLIRPMEPPSPRTCPQASAPIVQQHGPSKNMKWRHFTLPRRVNSQILARRGGCWKQQRSRDPPGSTRQRRRPTSSAKSRVAASSSVAATTTNPIWKPTMRSANILSHVLLMGAPRNLYAKQISNAITRVYIWRNATTNAITVDVSLLEKILCGGKPTDSWPEYANASIDRPPRHMEDGCAKRFDIGTLNLQGPGFTGLGIVSPPRPSGLDSHRPG